MRSEDKNIVCVIQARCGSTRLPNKVMFPIADGTLLDRMIERVRAAQNVDTIVVATTQNQEDDPIEALAVELKLECFRGDEANLLDRHYQAAKKYLADIVIKIPSDCPLIDPLVIDKVIDAYLEDENAYDYVSNLHPATYPDGNDVEVMRFSALEKAWQEAKKPYEREHTTPYFWENTHLFRCKNVSWESGENYSMSHRWTIDYMEDYHFIRKVYEELYVGGKIFSLEDILKLLANKPEIMQLNERYVGVNWYHKHLDELQTISESETKSP